MIRLALRRYLVKLAWCNSCALRMVLVIASHRVSARKHLKLLNPSRSQSVHCVVLTLTKNVRCVTCNHTKASVAQAT